METTPQLNQSNCLAIGTFKHLPSSAHGGASKFGIETGGSLTRSARRFQYFFTIHDAFTKSFLGTILKAFT